MTPVAVHPEACPRLSMPEGFLPEFLRSDRNTPLCGRFFDYAAPAVQARRPPHFPSGVVCSRCRPNAAALGATLWFGISWVIGLSPRSGEPFANRRCLRAGAGEPKITR